MRKSAGELRSQLYLALDLNYISNEEIEKLKLKSSEVSKMIYGLIKYLLSTL
ncbi:MAG TPA: four helix bundle protein [Salinimicrobium sp.]|nr:four helix bundle protein [Salinimicrobium sp.]